MFDVAIDYLLDDETERAPDIAPMNALNNLHKEAQETIMNTAWKVNLRIQSNTGKYGPEITPYLNTFHTVEVWK